MGEVDYVIGVHASVLAVDAAAWDGLLAAQAQPSPFMRHAYLAALHESGSACTGTGWTPHCITLHAGGVLQAACMVYLKNHSYGEYVFDWAWASAYQQHGIPYYPKAVIAVPFTPVPGARLLARHAQARAALLRAVVAWCEEAGASSLHTLFASDDDVQASEAAGLMLRHTVQFHWKNMAPTLGTGVSSLPPEGERFALGRPGGETGPHAPPLRGSLPPEGVRFALGRPGGETGPHAPPLRGSLPPEGVRFALGRPGGETGPFQDFDAFLSSLAQDKRKKIRQERRKVAQAGVTFRHALGEQISEADWDFFYRCYQRTYLEHGNPPYLNRDFFARMARTMPEHWLLFVAERNGHPIASSLIAIGAYSVRAGCQNDVQTSPVTERVAYGRYWGALEAVDCLHFEACYYQPLAWCIDNGYQRFEGGAQGEHKMARALLPVKTSSTHWLAHPDFADAVARFLEREGQGVGHYLDALGQRSPFRNTN